jgi:histidinol-phosphate aminotransferase
VSKGTKVLIPVPTFFLYEKIVHVLEGELVAVHARHDLSFDVEKIIAAAVKEKPAVIILNAPNSPTGQMVTINDVERICSETDAIILVDEAYIEFAAMPSVLPLIQKYDRVVILRTFSKAFSLAGLRIGYSIAQPEVCSEFLKPKIPFTVNNFSSSAAIKLMREKDLILKRIQYIKEQKEYLYNELSRIDGIKTFSSQSNFLIFTVKNDAASLFNKLLSENVLIRDVSSYPMLENTLRVSVGTQQENTAFLSALKKHL